MGFINQLITGGPHPVVNIINISRAVMQWWNPQWQREKTTMGQSHGHLAMVSVVPPQKRPAVGCRHLNPPGIIPRKTMQKIPWGWDWTQKNTTDMSILRDDLPYIKSPLYTPLFTMHGEVSLPFAQRWTGQHRMALRNMSRIWNRKAGVIKNQG